MKSISLFYKQSGSDKVYQASIEAKDAGFVVNFAFGRRGNTLSTGSKTTSPVTLEKAEAIFEKLVQEKKAKGYQEQEGATPYQHSETRVSGVLPQLLNPVDEDDVQKYIEDDRYCAQEKLDGRNIMVRKTNGVVDGINKKGLVVGLPEPIIESAKEIPTKSFLIAGEAIGDVLHAHDILEKDGMDLRQEIYGRRNAILASMVVGAALRRNDLAIKVVMTAWSAMQKKVLYGNLKSRGAEGIVFKLNEAPFTPGRPASGGPQLKVKFYATLSAVVDSVNTKRSVNLKLTNEHSGPTEEEWRGIGKCTVSPNFEMPKAGDVVEVRYLYAFKESNALYQTIYLGKRDDVEASECVLSQLKYKPDNES